MLKIATPNDLRAELKRLLVYCQEARPSREKIASELRGLADRVAGMPQAKLLESITTPLGNDVRVTFTLDGDPLHFQAHKGDIPLHGVEQLVKRLVKVNVTLQLAKQQRSLSTVTYTAQWVDKRTGESVEAPVEIKL